MQLSRSPAQHSTLRRTAGPYILALIFLAVLRRMSRQDREISIEGRQEPTGASLALDFPPLTLHAFALSTLVLAVIATVDHAVFVFSVQVQTALANAGVSLGTLKFSVWLWVPIYYTVPVLAKAWGGMLLGYIVESSRLEPGRTWDLLRGNRLRLFLTLLALTMACDATRLGYDWLFGLVGHALHWSPEPGRIGDLLLGYLSVSPVAALKQVVWVVAIGLVFLTLRRTVPLRAQ